MFLFSDFGLGLEEVLLDLKAVMVNIFFLFSFFSFFFLDKFGVGTIVESKAFNFNWHLFFFASLYLIQKFRKLKVFKHSFLIFFVVVRIYELRDVNYT